MALNVPLSVLLVRLGVEGAALGTATAMVAASILLMSDAHHLAGLSLGTTWRKLAQQQRPLWITCAWFGIATHEVFDWWFRQTDVSARYAVTLRLGAVVLAVLLYAACVGLMLAMKVVLVGLSEDERRHVARWRVAVLDMARMGCRSPEFGR
jgi:hypothetical protein